MLNRLVAYLLLTALWEANQSNLVKKKDKFLANVFKKCCMVSAHFHNEARFFQWLKAIESIKYRLWQCFFNRVVKLDVQVNSFTWKTHFHNLQMIKCSNQTHINLELCAVCKSNYSCMYIYIFITHFRWQETDLLSSKVLNISICQLQILSMPWDLCLLVAYCSGQVETLHSFQTLLQNKLISYYLYAFFNSLRLSDTYMRRWSNHHWFR